jgi:hypothetical protein
MHPAKARRLATAIGAALPFVLYASPARLDAAGAPAPIVTTTTAAAIEWDLPAQMDSLPGAIISDTNGNGRLWFVTRDGVPNPNVYLMNIPSSGKKLADASWFAWPLDPTGLFSSGLRRMNTSKDGRFIFIRSTFALQRIDIGSCATVPGTPPQVTCKRTVWDPLTTGDPAAAQVDGRTGSDIAIDDSNNVYSVFGVQGDATDADGSPIKSFIERLTPDGKGSNVVHWYVGGDAGICNFAQFSGPCLSGVAISPRAKNLVYFAEPVGGDGTGAIGELDPATGNVRRWALTALNADGDIVQEPRQIQFDSDGILWVVTGSGHLVSLDPRRSRMSKHPTPAHAPAGTITDPFGVAPDGGIIGYTDNSDFQNKVAMLVPRDGFVTVVPTPLQPVPSRSFTNNGNTLQVTRAGGSAKPTPKTFVVTRTPAADGTYIEARTDTASGNDSFNPAGITPDRGASVGTFFYAVGATGNPSMNRIGRVRLPRNAEHARVERDDDDPEDNDGPSVTGDDADDDGIEDSFDTPDKRETKQTSAQDVAGGASSLDQFMLNPGTLLAVFTATSSTALAPVTVEVVNDAGQVVASGLTTPGTAALTWTPPAAGGLFTLRVRNQALGVSTISTTILTRQLPPL